MNGLQDISDIGALTQLRDSLYGATGGRRAAVMVGAGFSRNAQLAAADSPVPPLWTDFERAMSALLYPGQPAVSGNPLRLAEEFAVFYGRAALDDLIRRLMPDDSWQPSRTHDRLLALPWTDVLTTNWDTLLERASQRSLHRRYSVVRTVGDMAIAQSPRIVKLHGSLPSHTPFVFTEEDYRKYPTTHAAFVNLARQVFIENELALIGFSGDDPNFLQWAGWVRDQLRDHSRRLYLVGLLGLSASRRRLLESLNFAVVDLSPAVAHLPKESRHEAATQLFLDFLEAGKPRRPTDWPFVPDRVTNESLSPEKCRHLLADWTANRHDYPGWFICPHVTSFFVRRSLATAVQQIEPVFDALSSDDKATCLRESAWQCLLVGLAPPPWLLLKMRAVFQSDGVADAIDQAGKRDIALAIADSARIVGDQPAFEVGIALLDALGVEGAAWSAFLRGLRHRDMLDLAALEKILDLVKGDDPVWLLRRAGLTASSGRMKEARALYKEALVNLRLRNLREPRSIWIRSRLAWAELFARVSQGFQPSASDDPIAKIAWDDNSTSYEADLDPSRLLDSLRQELAEAERQESLSSQQQAPRFDSGIYVDEPPQKTWYGPGVVGPAASIRFVLDLVASTGEFGHVSFFGEDARRAATLAASDSQGSNAWASFLCRKSSKSGLMETLYRRAALAILPKHEAAKLVQRMTQLAVFVLDRCDARTLPSENDFGEWEFWISRLTHVLEVLSRVAVRVENAEAAALHSTALAWAHRKSLAHWWTHEPYTKLISRTWDAVPEAQRRNFALDHLVFPLITELSSSQDMDKWPEPTDQVTKYVRPKDATQWVRRFDQLVEFARTPGQQRQHALRRLFNLHLSGCLTPEESTEVGEAMWAVVGDAGLPEGTGMHDFVVYEVPAPSARDANTAFRHKYFDRAELFRADARWMADAHAGAALAHDAGLPGPSAAIALDWADRIARWRPRKLDSFTWPINEGVEHEMPLFLRDAVVASLGPEHFTDALWTQLVDLVERVPRAVIVVPSFAGRGPAYSDRALALVRGTLWQGARERSLGGALAVHEWLEHSPELEWSSLADDVIALCTVPRHSSAAVLWRCLAAMAQKGFILGSRAERTLQALEMLEHQTDYATWNGLDSRWEEEAPLVIAEAVRTAMALSARGVGGAQVQKWLDRGDTDPLPEVRRAKQMH